MPYLTCEQIQTLSDDGLVGSRITVTREPSTVTYTLVESNEHGKKGVTWRVKNDLGQDFALKIIPSSEYVKHSLFDEMTKASKLDSKFFARVDFFGKLEFEQSTIDFDCMAIIIEWITGSYNQKVWK